MKDIINKVFGFELKVSVPETNAEFDQMAGSTNAACDSAVKNTLYRAWNNVFRAEMCEKLESATGIERKTKSSGRTKTIKGENGAPDVTEEVLVWDETEGDYFKRVKAAKPDFDYASLATFIAAGIAFDPSETERAEAGPRKLAKIYVDAATQAVSAGNGEKVAAKLSTLLNRKVEPAVDSIAAAMRDYKAQQLKNLANEFVG